MPRRGTKTQRALRHEEEKIKKKKETKFRFTLFANWQTVSPSEVGNEKGGIHIPPLSR